MKVAIASSGLGHVSRGMEAWAKALASALYEQGIDVTLFRGAGPARSEYDVVLPCIRRTSQFARVGNLLNHVGGWRVGLGSEAAVESFSFGVQLLQHLRKGYDLVHVQQGSLALFLLRAQRLGLMKCPMIFGNGQKGRPDVLRQFPYLHFLTPYGMQEVTDHVGKQPFWRIIPNFIDTETFSPAEQRPRRDCGLPENGLVILSIGMVDTAVKRMDYLIRESARFAAESRGGIHVVIAGSPHRDSREIEEWGRSLLGGNFHVFYNLPRERMPDLYRSADLFVLCSPREAQGMAIIEAMSCGVPVVCHDFPVMRWVVGDGGICIDMKASGRLSQTLGELCADPDLREKLGHLARERAVAAFSKQAVTESVLEMYEDVLRHERGRVPSLCSKHSVEKSVSE